MSTMSAAAGPIEQSIRARAIAARKRLAGGNNQVRTDKVVVMSIVKRGEVKSRVRVSPDVPLPTPLKDLARKGKAIHPDLLDRAQRILVSIAQYRHVAVKEICGGTRRRAAAWARHEVCYRLRSELGLSTPQIAFMIGRSDHTTVLHSLKRYAAAHNLPIV